MTSKKSGTAEDFNLCLFKRQRFFYFQNFILKIKTLRGIYSSFRIPFWQALQSLAEGTLRRIRKGCV